VNDYDVIVVGASIAGCTAATLLARSGVRVGLLEAHRDAATYKRLCTHYIQSSATPVIERLGIAADLDAGGAVHNLGDFWTRYGWVRESDSVPGCPPFGYSVRRQVLDPLLRATAEAEPNVELRLGVRVRDLLRDSSGRVVGVAATSADGEVQLRARVVIGADGKASKVAEAGGLPAKTLPNGRFAYFAHYRGVDVPGAPRSKLWLHDNGDAMYVFPNDDGVTLLATMPLKSRLDEFRRAGLEQSLLASFEGLPEAPDMAAAERVSDVIGTTDYPNVLRPRIVRPGLALAGDAAMTGDPLWGIGCGWAFQSGAWLADELGPAIRDSKDVDAALARYAKTHRKRLRPHFKLASDFSTGRRLNALERLLYGAAPHDAVVANAFWQYGTRNRGPNVLLSPRVLARAMRARRRAGITVPTQRVAQPEDAPVRR
jgi:2-polyprenyl-6-methoxyphenol hydroxylase-like FAD-dependent oxidoreductase